jgi:hypothetical protein
MDTTFEDSLVDVQDSSYCYQLRVTDKCGHIRQYSNEGCTIVLKGGWYPYEHHLSWSDYSDWKPGVGKFVMERSDSAVADFYSIGQRRIECALIYRRPR